MVKRILLVCVAGLLFVVLPAVLVAQAQHGQINQIIKYNLKYPGPPNPASPAEDSED